MDLSDLNRASATPPPAEDAARWREMLATLSAETSGPLTAALERVQALTTTGRIDRASLRALADEIQHARQAGMLGQQLTRLASGQLRQAPERLRLTDTLAEVLHHRARETQARGILVKQVFKPAEVMADPALLFNLLGALVGWSLAQARSNIEYRTDLKAWPAHARIRCSFAYRPADHHVAEATDTAARAALDTLTWRLIEQTARAMDLVLARTFDGVHVTVTLEFPRTVGEPVQGVSAVEMDKAFAPSSSGNPVAGSQVLVVASRRDVRVQVRDALRNMGLVLDFVGSVDEARDFCRSGVPHAVVIESALRGDRFNLLRRECEGSSAEVVFIEIIEEGHGFEVSGFGGVGMARVGRDAIAGSLPSALMFELAKTA